MADERVEHIRITERVANSLGCTPYGAGRSIDLVRGDGAFLYDRSGRSYVDLANVFGSVLLGHGDPVVVEAVTEAVRSGVPAGAAVRGYCDLVDLFSAGLGTEVRAAFYKTGTAAVRAAVLAARSASGKRLILCAGYHGHDDMWAPAPLLTANDDGVVDFFYVPQLLEQLLAERGRELAAVVIGPDYVHASPEGIDRLFDLCSEASVLTICDDVKYGYRMCVGSSLQLIGRRADLTVFSKGLANGWPVAAVVGDPGTMEAFGLATSTATFDAPTLAATYTTLRRIVELDVPSAVAREGGRFVEGVRRLLTESQLPLGVAGGGNAFQLFGREAAEQALVEQALNAGIVMEPDDQQLPSWAFRDEVVDEALLRLERALGMVAEEHPDLIGEPLTSDDLDHAAWRQMDGVPENRWDLGDAMAFLEEQGAMQMETSVSS